MRDPAGHVDTSGASVLRHLHRPLPSTHFLHLSVASKLVAAGQLTPFALRSDQLIESSKISFVSYPYEWTHSQLLRAAICTLDVAEAALEAGYEIKDATAFNVIFCGTSAQFCDHMSFEPITTRYWWPYGQFLRHFLLPLALSKLTGTAVSGAFRSALDGIPLEHGKALLGPRRWGHRICMALWQGRQIDALPSSIFDTPTAAPQGTRAGLFRFLRWQLDGLSKPAAGRSEWDVYESTRIHYTSQALDYKRATVGKWMLSIRPRVVLDLGCNQGEFSLLAADIAEEVIALDADEASLETLRHRIAATGTTIQTVLARLDDPSPARGWGGREHVGLIERLDERADMVLALALLHHIVLGLGISIENVAELLARLARQYLVVELIPPDDEKARQISESRNRRDAAEAYSLERQRHALSAHFDLIEELSLTGSHRMLALLRKKAAHAP